MRRGIVLVIFFWQLAGINLYAAEIQWFLAASLSKPAREIVNQFNIQAEDCAVLPVVGGSGQLLSKITLSKKGDLYSPASVEFLQRAQTLGIVADSRLLLKQFPVFGLSTVGAQKISSFEDLTAQHIKIALGNPKTMALGNSYLKIEKKMAPALAAQIRRNTKVEAINVNQIVSYLLLGVIDAGTIFDTVAKANRIPYITIPKEYNVETSSYLIRLIYTKKRNRSCVAQFLKFIVVQDDTFSKFGFRLNKQTENEDL